MAYAKIVGGAVDTYPLSLNQIKALYPSSSFGSAQSPASILQAILDIYDDTYVEVQATAQPAYDNLTETVAEGTPVYSDPDWVQVWVVSDLPLANAQRNYRGTLNSIVSQKLYGGSLSVAGVGDISLNVETWNSVAFDGMTAAWAQATGGNWSGFIKLAGGNYANVPDKSTMKDIVQSLYMHKRDVGINGRALTQAINGAGDMTALRAIDLDAGWP